MNLHTMDFIAMVTTAIVIISCAAVMPFMPTHESGDPIAGMVVAGFCAALYAVGRAEGIIK